MKKSILIFALAGIFGVATFASDKYAPVNTNEQTELTQEREDDKFETIRVDQVPEAVQTAAITADSGAVIESAEEKVLENGEKVYRLTIRDQVEGEVTKTFHANGKKYEKE